MVDHIDEEIAKLFSYDARQSTEVLAIKVGVSQATIRRRLKGMLQRNIMRIVGIVDPRAFGFQLAAVIALDISADKLHMAGETLADLPEIRWVSTCTGRFDMLAIGRFRSTDELAEFQMNTIAKLDGLHDFETFVCLNLMKATFVPLA